MLLILLLYYSPIPTFLTAYKADIKFNEGIIILSFERNMVLFLCPVFHTNYIDIYCAANEIL